eukprot:CAMPEP_0179170304 /NCGR_PEP_ID=MMETSP0796-20121207/83887_1 /TAXON_ID=73915 /ORGANISM="Pyrodinium bahamense, Strain pbaha01" /LENGTH=49 /DNA_ID= /DNA_START= /DNA_END= /DNA_ORIENTATION=
MPMCMQIGTCSSRGASLLQNRRSTTSSTLARPTLAVRSSGVTAGVAAPL